MNRRQMVRTGFLTVAWGLATLISGTASPSANGQSSYEGEPINYLKDEAHDPVARLQERMDRGEARLEFDQRLGYLPSVLEYLGVPPSSQMLVFSKTSFQHTRISPRSPRALYFNDSVYLGYVRGGEVLEIATVDPKLGTVFYLLDQERAEQPRFERETHACLSCHASGRTQDVPGLLVRSIYPAPDGQPVYNAGSFVTDHTSPLKERWGGWYVTGTHGDQRHMGNVFVRDRSNPENLDTDAGANVTDLSGRFGASSYLTDTSDIVALMLLEHQTQMQNRIIAASYEARMALHQQAVMNEALGRPADTRSDTTRRRIEGAAEKLVEYLLFSGETKLTAPIAGTSGYSEQFASQGPRDGQGRSLRDFDLKTRLFRYPCSYLIDSESFDSLPGEVKQYVYRRLVEILGGEDQSPRFAHLSPDDRKAILEILRATKADFPRDVDQADSR